MAKKMRDDSRSERAAAAMRDQQRQERRRQGILVGGIVLVLLAIVVALFVALRGEDSGGSSDPGAAPNGVDGFGVVIGEDSAPSEIRIYEDFQCPVCAQFEAAVAEPMMAAVDRGDVKVEYRLVSFLDPASENEFSSRALNAALVVLDTAGKDAFREFHETVYANQPAEGTAGPEDETLIQWAVDAGATESEVRGPIEDKAFEGWIADATDQMSEDGVGGTPTVFIDDEPAGDNPQESIEQILELVQ